jgi:hypothetical protein
MKHIKIFRIFGIALVLAILLTAIPVLAAVTTNTITLSSASGKVGDTITVHGIFIPGSVMRIANVYFSPNNLIVGQSIALATTIKTVAVVEILNLTDDPVNAGNFTATFAVPFSLTEGTIAQNVTAGIPYYVYVTDTTELVPLSNIKAKATFTVTQGATLDTLDPTSGPPGTTVGISGNNFPASTPLVFKFDTTFITPTSGHTTTLSNGLFFSIITIPATATAGAHTITVTAGATTLTRTFTVTASAALDALQPVSGVPGAFVAISGTNFPASAAIVFKFDTTTLTPTGSSQTGSNGGFASIITIPSSAAAGAHTITVTVGTTERTATFTVTGTTASANLSPLSPAFGPVGTQVTVSGTNFPAGNIAITFDGAPLTLSGNTQTSGGSFTSIITIPQSTATSHTITVTAGSSTATATFTVTGTATPTPTPSSLLNIKAGGDTVGSSIAVAHAGFVPNSKVTVTYDGVKVAEDNTDASGFFVITFQAPSSMHGIHAITASDGTNIASANFTVESIPPIVPLPLSPGMGASVDLPATFDWADVIDASLPVTYNLQIATSANFTADSIVIDKTALTKSEYTLSELDELKLGGEVTYYWREQAVDAALNASDWTGAGAFTVSQPFTFTGWPLYLTICVGAVLIFLFGLWIGRRTAFYY